MSDYPKIRLEDAGQELNRLHLRITSNNREANMLKRRYNNMLAKEHKLRDKEQLLEYLYCNSLLNNGVCYKSQVSVENGRIDVLTDDFIIELKYGSSRTKVFEAIGQLNYYSMFYPGRDLKIVLSENPSMQVLMVLKKLNILLEVFNV
jgi:hypothetical protein